MADLDVGHDSMHFSNWENDPAFGIVHPSGCRICRRYMAHVAAAANDAGNHPTFKSALEMRDGAHNTQYLSGVAEGRRLQRKHETDQRYLLNACLADRDQTLDRNLNLSAQLHKSQEELKEMKQQFHALQMLFDEIADVNSTEQFWEPRGSSYISGAAPFGLESCLPTPPDSFSGSNASDIFELPVSPTSSHAPPRSETSESDIGSDLQVTLPPIPPPPTILVPTTLSQIQTSDLATPTTAPQMEALMNDGCRPGNTEALAKVRTLYTRAQLTPRGQQNDIQQLLLSRWKGPRSCLMSSDGEEYTLRRSKQAPANGEVFVDSSPSWGIGFIMDGKWLAWKFKDGWQSGGKDNHWAELVGVELGLRVAIAAGCHSAPLVIRSDNVGVVHSLMTEKERNPERLMVLQNIKQLSHNYNVEVTPRWIPTKENPADGPSRGVFPARSLLFSTPPSLPEYLIELLENPVAFHSLSS